MRTRRLITPSGILGALALSVAVCAPAWAMWDGYETRREPIMPSWTWQGVEQQEQLRDLTPEERDRAERLSGAEREQYLQERAEHYERARTGGTRNPSTGETRRRGGGDEREDMRQPSRERTQSDSREQREEAAPSNQPDADADQAPSDERLMERAQPDMRHGQDEAAPEHREVRQGDATTAPSGDEGMIRQEVPLKPVPKSESAPAPGEPNMPDNPIDAARAHVSMAQDSLKADDWNAARDHVRAAGDELDRIQSGSNPMIDRYINNLKEDMRRTEKAIDMHARDAGTRLDSLDSRLRTMRPEERSE